MIQSIELQNFQSHESTDLDLHPGLNVFSGSGDSGKSAILRAIRWNQSNRIRHNDATMGDSYVSDWAKSTSPKGAVTLTADCKVSVIKPEGTCIRFREAPKGKGDKERNGYDLNGSRFEAIGVTVPEQVTEFFNWSEVNVQRQQDKAFLISQNAGDVATFLNRTVRLDAIDSHVQAANSLLRTEKAALNLLESKQADDQRALEALAWVPGVLERLEALEALAQTATKLRTDAGRLATIAQQIEAQNARIKATTAIVSLEPRVQELRRLNDWRKGLMDQRHRLRETADQWERWTVALRTSGPVAKLSLEPVRKMIEARDKLQETRRGLMVLRVQWEKATGVLERSNRLPGLVERVAGLRVLVEKRTAIMRERTALRDLVERWESVSVDPRDWDGLARKAKILRARVNRVQGVREEIEGIRKFLLNYAGLETIIQESGARVAELVTMRPETCPLCGGPMHKGEHP